MGFIPATRKKSKLKIALTGPSGSGKTYSALLIAKGLGGKIAVIDSERGSASLYAGKEGLPAFDVVELEKFEPEEYVRWIKEGVKGGYETIIIDSISPEWTATKEFVDKVAQSTGNSWAAWSQGTPKHNAVMNAILQSPIHVLVTMRVKTEWTTEKDERTGKTKPVKIGLTPDQRAGIEYEFTTIFDIGEGHLASVSKDRTELFPSFEDRITPEVGERFKVWLDQGEENPGIVPLSDLKNSKIFALFHDLGLDYESAAIKKRLVALTGKDSVSLMSEKDGDILVEHLETKLKEVEKEKAKQKAAGLTVVKTKKTETN